MKFTTPCFIRKNTPELRKKLEEMGYNTCECCERNGYHWLRTSHKDGGVHGIYTDYKGDVTFLYGHNGEIDTGTNEALFLALAALREDSDYMQWFVYPEHDLWHLCREENLKHIYVEWEEGEADARTCFHKASSAELIEHLKNNE